MVILLLVLLAAAFLIALNLTPGAIARDEHFERIVSSGVLRVGMDASFPPFETIDEHQQLVGFDVDLAQDLAQRMNLRAEFVLAGFDALYPELSAQHFDVIISALPYDRTRTRDVAYSDIYFHGGEVLLVRADNQGVKSLSDLNGQVVGVEFGTGAETLATKLERRSGYRVQSFNTLEDAARALDAGAVRAVIADAVSARLVRQAHPQLTIAGEPLGDEPNYVIAMPLNAPTLLATINKHLRAMEKDGTLKRLMEKWF